MTQQNSSRDTLRILKPYSTVLSPASVVSANLRPKPFLSLPPEIRVFIYRFVFNNAVLTARTRRLPGLPICRILSLLSVSRFVRAECLPIYFSTVFFYIDDILGLQRLAVSIRSRGLLRIRHLAIPYWGERS